MNVRNSLHLAKISQGKFARSVGVSRHAFNVWLNGYSDGLRRSKKTGDCLVDRVKAEMIHRGWVEEEMTPFESRVQESCERLNEVRGTNYKVIPGRPGIMSSPPINLLTELLSDAEKVRVIYAVMDSCHLDDKEGWESNLKIVGKLFPEKFPNL